MFEEISKVYSLGFEQQFHYACFYSYIKIKEQEVKNLVFLAELTGRSGNEANMMKNDYIVPFIY